MRNTCSHFGFSFRATHVLNTHQYPTHLLTCTDLNDGYYLDENVHIIWKHVHCASRTCCLSLDDLMFQARDPIVEDTKTDHLIDEFCVRMYSRDKLDELLNLFNVPLSGASDNIEKDTNVENAIKPVHSFSSLA